MKSGNQDDGMEDQQPVSRVPIVIPIRVRGMSIQNKFFDESTETHSVGESLVITRLENAVDLETEVHVINTRGNVGGTFRVVWVNSLGRDGWHDVGLELVEAGGDLWGPDFGAAHRQEEATVAHAWLQCRRCQGSQLAPVPEADDEFICDGFTIARHCDQCKATTSWGFTPVSVKTDRTRDKVTETAGARQERLGKDQRRRVRAPIAVQIKIVREKYGTTLEDVCETINVSRDGAYFLTTRHYEVGEPVKVIVPYKEGEITIPMPARVVRRDEAKDSYHHPVAIQIERAKQ